MKKTALFILILSLFGVLSYAGGTIKVISKPGPGQSDFKVASLKVLSPNGGETWGMGAFGYVTWSAANVTQNVNVWLKIAGSSAVYMIKQNVPPGTHNAIYTVPANMGYSGKIFKVVVATMDGKIMDESDDTFTIRKMNITANMTDSGEQQYSGPCPITLNFGAQINVEFPCWVTYNFYFEDGSESQTFKTYVVSVKDVAFARTISKTLEGHITISILSPVKLNSGNSAYFKVHCTEPLK
jgi:hypothetical protein